MGDKNLSVSNFETFDSRWLYFEQLNHGLPYFGGKNEEECSITTNRLD